MIRLSSPYGSNYHSFLRMGLLLFAITVTAPRAIAQDCTSGADLDDPTKSAIETAARRYLDMSKHGDVAGLKANSIPAIAGDFGSIEQAVVTNKQYLSQGPATVSRT